MKKKHGHRVIWGVAVVLILVLGSLACTPAAVPTPTPTRPPAAATSAPAAAPAATPTVAAPQPTPTYRPATVRFGSIRSTSDAGVYVALEKGYFKEVGLDLDLQVFGSGAAMLAPLTTGELDAYGSGIATGILNAMDRGVALKVVADKGTSGPGFEFAQILVRKDLWDSGQVKDVKDIKGKKVGVTSVAGNSEAAVAYLIKQAGLTTKDIELMPMAYTDMIAALSNKGLDVVDMVEPTLSTVLGNGLAVTWPQGPRSFTYSGTYQAGVMIFSAQFAQNVDVARRFMVAYVKGIRDYNDAFAKGKGKNDIINILIKHTALKDPARYEKMNMPGLSPDGKVHLPSFTMDLDYFKQMGYYTGKLTIQNIVDNQFTDYAVQQLGPYK